MIFIFSPDQFKCKGNIEIVTSNWFGHSKAYGKRAEIARIIKEEIPRETMPLLLFNEDERRKRPASEALGAKAKPSKLLKVHKARDTVTVTTAEAKPPSALVKTSNLDITSLKVAELKEELSALGLPKSGKKAVLLARLMAYIAEGNPNPLERKIDNLKFKTNIFKK